MNNLKIAIMIEGQMGLNWARWQRIARAVEDLGFAGLFRSDHFLNPDGPPQDSLDLWASLLWLADNTERIEFGPLVSPVSFRHPAHTARLASAVDDLSGGRLTLGLGAGWNEREHEAYSFDLLPVPERFKRFEEALSAITCLLQEDRPLTLRGEYYTFNEAVLRPRPARPGGPPILVGGNGPQYTLPLVARFADEWNAVYLSIEQCCERCALLDTMLTKQGRNLTDVRRSMMTGLFFGRTDAEVDQKLGAVYQDMTREKAREHGAIIGTASEVQEQLAELAEKTPLHRVMLQWFDLDDLDGLEAFAQAVL